MPAKSVSPLLIWQTVPVPSRSRLAASRRDVKATLSLLFGCELKKNEYSDIGVRIETLGHWGGLVCHRNKYKVTTIKKTLSKVDGIQ